MIKCFTETVMLGSSGILISSCGAGDLPQDLWGTATGVLTHAPPLTNLSLIFRQQLERPIVKRESYKP